MTTTHNDESKETILQQITSLPLIGEFLTTLIDLIPFIVMGLIRRYIFQSSSEPEKLLIIIGCIITLGWILFLEKVGKIRVTTPIIPIPIKWLVIPFAVIYLFFV